MSHICFVAPYAYGYLKPNSGAPVGGAERQQYLLGDKIKSLGHDVTFITYNFNQNENEIVNGKSLLSCIRNPHKGASALEVLYDIYAAMHKSDADVYYSRGNPKLGIITYICSKIVGKPHIYCIANEDDISRDNQSNTEKMMDYIFRKAMSGSTVLSQTENQRRILRHNYDIESIVLPNSYYVPPEEELKSHSERENVIWVGTIDKIQKRPHLYLDLAERTPDLDFLLIGDGKDKEYKKSIIDRAEKMPNVSYEGFVPPDQINKYYRDAIALVNTSSFEGFPNTYLEAWHYGTPVLALEFSLNGALASKDIGFLEPNLNECGKILKTLEENQERFNEISQRSREYFISNYDIDTISLKFEAIVNDLA